MKEQISSEYHSTNSLIESAAINYFVKPVKLKITSDAALEKFADYIIDNGL